MYPNKPFALWGSYHINKQEPSHPQAPQHGGDIGHPEIKAEGTE